MDANIGVVMDMRLRLNAADESGCEVLVKRKTSELFNFSCFFYREKHSKLKNWLLIKVYVKLVVSDRLHSRIRQLYALVQKNDGKQKFLHGCLKQAILHPGTIVKDQLLFLPFHSLKHGYFCCTGHFCKKSFFIAKKKDSKEIPGLLNKQIFALKTLVNIFYGSIYFLLRLAADVA